MLNSFSSFFEIFGGLNLAYAGSEGFRNAIDDEILKLKNAISPNINEQIKQTKSKITVTVAEDYEGKLNDKALQIEVDYDEESKALLLKEEVEVKFTDVFKSMFLATSLYCISLLILGGFEQSIPEYSGIINLFLLFLLPVFCFNLYVFYRSFKYEHDNKIKPLTTILFIISLFLLTFLDLKFIKHFPQYCFEQVLTKNTIISFSLFIAISPYLFHFLRVYIHKIIFRYKFMKLEKKILERLDEIDKWLNFTK